MIDPYSGWILTLFCIAPLSDTMCRHYQNLQDEAVFHLEEDCVDWAGKLAQKWYDKQKLQLEYSCTEANPHPNGMYVPHRRK